MKRTFAAAIVLAFAIQLTPRCAAKERAAEVAKYSNSQQSQPPDADETPEWILIVITGITAGFICWQAWETRKAAQATQKSAATMENQTGILRESVAAARDAAKAAKASADATE